MVIFIERVQYAKNLGGKTRNNLVRIVFLAQPAVEHVTVW